MATYLDDLKYPSNNTQIWKQACKGTLSKPLLPFGKAKDTFNIAQKCKAIQEKYGLPNYQENEPWFYKKILTEFDARNPYVNDLKGCDTHIMSAKQVLEENIFREDYLYRKASSLGSDWKFNIYLEDVERFGKILISENTDQNTPEIPPMNVGETAMYFAYEAEVLKGIPRPRFNLALIEALQKNIDRILDGKDAEGLSSNFLQNTPPLPNFAAAFSIALPTEIHERIKSCEHEYWNAFGTFSRNLRRAYGQVGGWSKLYYGRKPEDKLPIKKDWGKELIHRKIELALLTNKCFDDVELLINTLRVYGGMCGNFGNGSLYFKPHLTRLNPLTKQERARRDRAEKERHKKAMERIRKQEEWEAEQRRRGAYGGYSGVDEFDEANGSYEFGNSYSYAWYTDRDSYNDVTR